MVISQAAALEETLEKTCDVKRCSHPLVKHGSNTGQILIKHPVEKSRENLRRQAVCSPAGQIIVK
jgi:hypothetical protein